MKNRDDPLGVNLSFSKCNMFVKGNPLFVSKIN